MITLPKLQRRGRMSAWAEQCNSSFDELFVVDREATFKRRPSVDSNASTEVPSTIPSTVPSTASSTASSRRPSVDVDGETMLDPVAPRQPQHLPQNTMRTRRPHAVRPAFLPQWQDLLCESGDASPAGKMMKFTSDTAEVASGDEKREIRSGFVQHSPSQPMISCNDIVPPVVETGSDTCGRCPHCTDLLCNRPVSMLMSEELGVRSCSHLLHTQCCEALSRRVMNNCRRARGDMDVLAACPVCRVPFMSSASLPSPFNNLEGWFAALDPAQCGTVRLADVVDAVSAVVLVQPNELQAYAQMILKRDLTGFVSMAECRCLLSQLQKWAAPEALRATDDMDAPAAKGVGLNGVGQLHELSLLSAARREALRPRCVRRSALQEAPFLAHKSKDLLQAAREVKASREKITRLIGKMDV